MPGPFQVIIAVNCIAVFFLKLSLNILLLIDRNDVWTVHNLVLISECVHEPLGTLPKPEHLHLQIIKPPQLLIRLDMILWLLGLIEFDLQLLNDTIKIHVLMHHLLHFLLHNLNLPILNHNSLIPDSYLPF